MSDIIANPDRIGRIERTLEKLDNRVAKIQSDAKDTSVNTARMIQQIDTIQTCV